MDFQWTNRLEIKPSWAADNPSTPRKRPHDELKTVTPSALGTPQTPIFGSNQNVPFMFNTTPSTSQPPHWAPPPFFSPEKAFPKTSFKEELKDVDMADISPQRVEERKVDPGRAIAPGAMRRVYNSRQKSRDPRIFKRPAEEGEISDPDRFDSDDDAAKLALRPLTQTTSNHYTLNLPATSSHRSDLPYVLLGYLQFGFNLSLILLFLYLVVQFIVTVQGDVEHRISEYSMDIVQEIAICALQYKTNLCASNPIPAMIQQCGNWETCMNRDPAIIGRAKVGAELIAEVVNGFIEPISWKALVFTLTSLSFLTVFINSLLSLYRARYHPIPIEPTQQQPFPTATSYPPHHFGGFLSPAPTPSWGRQQRFVDEDFQTPTRRRRLEGGAIKVK